MEKHFHVDHERRTWVTAYPNLTKSQRYAKSRDFYEKQIKYFSLKTKYSVVVQRRQLGASYWHAALLSFDNTSFSVEFFSKHPQTRHDILNITTLRFVILFSKKSRWFCKPLWFRYHVWIRRKASPPCVINMRIFFPCVKFDKVRKQKKHK